MSDERKKFQKSFTWDEFKNLSRLEKLSVLGQEDGEDGSEQ